jgi:4-amino-4-deoxy-L-arabinose transferase-like glycosyltransferase
MFVNLSLRRFLNKGLVLDIAISLVLFALAVYTRAPEFNTIPMINDETREVLLALDIAQGRQFPLVNVSTYIGPLFLYLLAVVFRVFGVSPEVPRLFVLGMGALTVVATYWLGKVWANRLAGFLGAALMVTASTHIWVNSHIANSASTVPLFTTLAILAFSVAKKNGSLAAWVAGGVLYGCALQMHPTIIFLAPILGLWFLLDPVSRKQLRTRGPYLAVGAAVVPLMPLLIHNVLTWGTHRASLDSVSRRTYAFALPESVGEYVGRIGLHLHQISRSFAAVFDPPRDMTEYFWSVLAIYVVLLVISVVYVARKGNALPALAFALTPLMLAFVSKREKFPEDSRYFAYLLPIGFLAIGMLWDGVLRAIWRWAPQEGWWSRMRWQVGGLPEITPLSIGHAVASAILLYGLYQLAVYPIDVLGSAKHYFVVNNFTARPMIDLGRMLKREQAQRVWVDEDLYGDAYWMCNGATAGEAFAYVITLNSIPVSVAPVSETTPVVGDWLAMTPENGQALAAHYALGQVAETPAGKINCVPASIVLYQVRGGVAK